MHSILKEAFTNQAVDTFETTIREKMDRDEIKELHSYIDTRFKTFKPKIKEQERGIEDKAAGTKKQLIMNCSCISCDRPLDMPIDSQGIIRVFHYHI